MNKNITVPNVYEISQVKSFDGSLYLPREIGELKLLQRETLIQNTQPQIIYYDWDLSFVNKTYASRPDNFGKDEIQIIFNMNRNIEWKIDCGNKSENEKIELVKMIPGEVCVFRNNNYKTSMIYDESVNFKFKSLQMKTKYFEELLSKYFHKQQIELCKNIFLTHVTKTFINSDMYRVLSEIDDAKKYHQFKGLFIEAKIIELTAIVLNSIFYESANVCPRRISEKNESFDNNIFSESDAVKIKMLWQRIKFNPADDYKSFNLARELGMSESKLTRLFHSVYGLSLHQYVKEQRLEKAASLILQSGMNISEVAEKCGYNNMSHFAKEFQKKFGITPKKFSTKKY